MLSARSARVRSAGVALAVATILLLSGCVPGSTTALRSFGPTGESVAAAVAPYYHQSLRWKSCGNGQQCATVTAPMDWDHPSKATDISLELTRAAATGSRLGSLFVNPGGPGASGYDLVHNNLDFAVSKTLQKRYDVIGWDPRGVGRSTPVKCYDDAGLDDFIYGVSKNAVNSAAWVDEQTADAKKFAAACLKNTGAVLGFIDTASTVRDLDMLRAVVGDSKLNYLGYSYGSDIGMYYDARFPAKVGHIVLDGSTDSTLSIFDISLSQSRGFEDALRHYLADCPKSKDCPFPGSVDDSLAKISALYDRLEEHPIVSNSRTLDGHLLDTAINSALYDKSSWQYLSTMFTELRVGTTDTAFLLADSYYGRDQDGTYKDNSTVAFIAIGCLDYPVVTDPTEIARENALLVAAAPTLSRTSVIGDVTCENWPFANRRPAPVLTGKGSAAILVLSTTGDPATPYQWGVALSKQLVNAHLVTRKGEGHTAFNRSIPCVDDAVNDYFVKSTVPLSDPHCTG